MVPLELKLHRWAGYTLTVFFAGHFIATRVGPIVYDLNANTGLLAVPLLRLPYHIFYVYYCLLGAAGFYHLFYGLPKALKAFGVEVPSAWRPGTTFFRYASVIGSAVLISSIFALGGAYFPIQLSQEQRYHEIVAELYAKVGIRK